MGGLGEREREKREKSKEGNGLEGIHWYKKEGKSYMEG